MISSKRLVSLALCAGFAVGVATAAHAQLGDSVYVRTHYDKTDYMVPVRDGVRLFTIVYTPKDASQKYPIILQRTCPVLDGDYRRTDGEPVFVKVPAPNDEVLQARLHKGRRPPGEAAEPARPAA